MGSSFVSTSFPGKLAPAELRAEFNEHCNEQEFEYGKSAYNGTLSTTSGLEIESVTLGSRLEAEEYVSDKTQKWGPAVAVRYRVTKKVVVKKPTFQGKTIDSSGRISKTLASVFTGTGYAKGDWTTVPADQLSKEEQGKILALHKSLELAEKMEDSLRTQLRTLIGRLHRVEEDFKEEDFKELKRIRRELKTASTALATAKKKFTTLDERLGKKIWEFKILDKGTTRWLVGGWTSE